MDERVELALHEVERRPLQGSGGAAARSDAAAREQALSLLSGRDRAAPSQRQGNARPPLRHLAPRFIIGFLLLVAARSAGFIPETLADPVSRIASGLTIVSMAALGLGVDVRTVARAGLRVSLVVTLSLLALGGAALLTIRALGLG